jgi:hypothetical protein
MAPRMGGWLQAGLACVAAASAIYFAGSPARAPTVKFTGLTQNNSKQQSLIRAQQFD